MRSSWPLVGALMAGALVAGVASLSIVVDPPVFASDTGNVLDVADNATRPLPHQDAAGWYSWDGDEWLWTPLGS